MSHSLASVCVAWTLLCSFLGMAESLERPHYHTRIFSILLSRLLSGLVDLGSRSRFRSTRQAESEHRATGESRVRVPLQSLKPGRGNQSGGWDNPFAYPLITSRRVEAALIRFMADKGWYHKGKAINYLLEDSLVSRCYLEPSHTVAEPTPEERSRQEHRDKIQSLLDMWGEMSEEARTHYRLRYPEITPDLIASARQRKLNDLQSHWAGMREEVKGYWRRKFPELEKVSAPAESAK